ncbi:MAG: DeoR/GlpR transcriptional regulator [Lachnospiraceae bacterium]|nr:DeoR/GlpR transcriptional regulator [Lachnospiraceae bacterium]
MSRNDHFRKLGENMQEDRKSEIIRLLSTRGYMTVEELAEQLYVSGPTVRRCLQTLAEEGRIKRIHGGASYIGRDSYEWTLDMRSRVNSREKRVIGKLAAELVGEGNHVFLDAGSTCHFLAKELDPSMKMTVLTNSIPTIMELSGHKNCQIESPCGQYYPSHTSFFGEESAAFIRTRHADFYFATSTAIDSRNGVSVRSLVEMSVKQAMRACADCMVLLMDHTKMETTDYYHLFDLSQVDILITDAPLPDSMREACERDDVEVILP